MLLLPGAEPFTHDGSSTGVLFCHGFTGTPQSLRAWAGHLAIRGMTVSLPLLPGHGTRWQDLQRTGWQDWYATVDRELNELHRRCEQVFVCGLSMGGALALRLAARRGQAVSGLALVNPAITFPRIQGYALPVLRHLLPTARGLISDIAKDGVRETGYERVPLHAAHSMRALFALVRAELPQVTQPLLVMHSRVDHVVPPSDSAAVLAGVSSVDTTERVLESSFHVATLDHDAERIFQETDAFITRLATRKTARDGT
ncbi:alpha/beta hydrolase [Streptomyces radicis]|uniref:Alpha/beta fold hydrolase n=1 Tax=Streptomyces radicis TaxID=1750517 RepID=A0A3A9VZM0_9ACTN|nr:alpha/beta fold hydrolase [Streptomyces radicis]RKN06140.1 alpha/beta fold hydrolase [Streptomyces radicis]RKN18511.1 alpha/beta fold hydrolase [Streptomyces radicis]